MEVDQIGLSRGVDQEAQWVKVRPEWIEMELARRLCMDMLMRRFGIDAALVSAPQLAKALGRSKSTIYAKVKAGSFFIPHRMVGDSPMFTIDDVVSWYLSGDAVPRPRSALEREGAEAGKSGALNEGAESLEEMASAEKGARDRAVDAWVVKAAELASRRMRASEPPVGRVV